MRKSLLFVILFWGCVGVSFALAQHAKKSNRPDSRASDDYFGASGLWKADRAEDDIKYQHVEEVNCFKGSNCIEAYAWIENGKLNVGLRYYEITRWNSYGIDAVNNTPPCLTNKLVINFGDKSVKALDAPKPPKLVPVPDLCKGLKLDHTITWTLVSSP